MTAREAERLTRVEERQKAMQGDIEEVKSDLKEIKKLLEQDRNTHSQFITKKAATTVLSVTLTVAILFFLFYDHLREAVTNK